MKERYSWEAGYTSKWIKYIKAMNKHYEYTAKKLFEFPEISNYFKNFDQDLEFYLTNNGVIGYSENKPMTDYCHIFLKKDGSFLAKNYGYFEPIYWATIDVNEEILQTMTTYLTERNRDMIVKDILGEDEQK